jgi:hypothetical protein
MSYQRTRRRSVSGGSTGAVTGAAAGAGGSAAAPSLVGGTISIPAYDPALGEVFEAIAARHRLWCRKVGEVPARSRTLAHRLHELGFEQYRPRIGAAISRQRRYLVPAELLPEGSAPVAAPPADLVAKVAEFQTAQRNVRALNEDGGGPSAELCQ